MVNGRQHDAAHVATRGIAANFDGRVMRDAIFMTNSAQIRMSGKRRKFLFENIVNGFATNGILLYGIL